MANSGTFRKGDNRKRKSKGDTHKTTRAAKEIMQLAFDELGGMPALVKWAKADPDHTSEFYKLWARLIPMDVTSDNKPLSVNINIPPLPDGHSGAQGGK